MPGPGRKSLEDLIREGTWRSNKARHRELLDDDDVQWPAFAELQRRYREAPDEITERAVARAFQAAVQDAYQQAQESGGGPKLAEVMDSLGPPGSADSVVNFFPRFLTWDDGSEFALEDWQEEMVREAYARDGEGHRIYKEILWGLARGLGKTPLASGLCLHSLCASRVRPKIFQAAGSKDQASIGTAYATNWVEDGELREWLRANARSVSRRDRRGSYTVMSADGRLGHGRKPTGAAVVDEWWLFRTAAERQTYIAIASALHKELESFLLAITTAGYDKTSQLGEQYDRALKLPDIEHRREGFLRIARDPEAGFLMWWWGMPEGYELDLEDDAAVLHALKLANPGSWVNHHEMLRMLRRGMDTYEWLRLCLNAWTRTKGAWVAPGTWDELRSDTEIPDRADVFVAVDAAHSYDSTAVSWVWISPEGLPVVRSFVWSLRDEVPAHVHVNADELDNERLVEPFIHDLGERYRIREVAADPNYFGTELRHLGERYMVSPIFPQSKEMIEYVQDFYRRVDRAGVAHDGDPVLRAHVTAIAGEKNHQGYWKLGKLKQADPIDAGTATIMAVGRATSGKVAKPVGKPRLTWLDE